MTTPNPFRGAFGPETFRARRERVYEALAGSAMVLPAAPIRYKAGDTEYRYRPDSELYYVSGLEEPEALAVLRDHADEERYVLFVRERDPEAEQWSGPRVGTEGATGRYAADAAYPMSELEARLPELLHGAGAVYYRLGTDVRARGAVESALRWSRRKGARQGRGPRSVVDPGQILDELRLVKEPEALDSLRRAASVTVAAFRALAGAVAPGVGEWELEALLESRFRAGGAFGPAFGTIVGGGVNACVLHYVDNARVLGEGDLVLVDAGAEVDFYAADVTRTFPVSGSFSPLQRDVYEVVAAAQAAAIERVRPGTPVAEVHDAAVAVIASGLVDLGIVDASPDAVVEEELYRPYYPHQTCHWLGLDVHESGDYAAQGRSRSLEPGMVLTVEPGLYFPPTVEDTAGSFTGVGIRLEDDILVTADGHERLTADLPVDAEGVAALVGSGRS